MGALGSASRSGASSAWAAGVSSTTLLVRRAPRSSLPPREDRHTISRRVDTTPPVGASLGKEPRRTYRLFWSICREMARGTPQGEGVGWMKSARKTATHLRKRLLDPKDTQAGFLVCALLVFHEVLLTSLITSKVGYTEIDWEVSSPHYARHGGRSTGSRRSRGSLLGNGIISHSASESGGMRCLLVARCGSCLVCTGTKRICALEATPRRQRLYRFQDRRWRRTRRSCSYVATL